jgi:hypothetical protein
MTETNDTVRFLKNYGSFLGILVVFLALLCLFITLSRPAWSRGLQAQIQTTLDRSYPGGYQVGDPVALNSSFFSTSAVFEVTGPDFQYGIILRTPTLFGPLPGVFLADAGGNIRFAGFTLRFDRFETQFGQSLLYPRLYRLEKYAREILRSANIGGQKL